MDADIATKNSEIDALNSYINSKQNELNFLKAGM